MTPDEKRARFAAFMGCVDELRYGYATATEYAKALLEIAVVLELGERPYDPDDHLECGL